MLADRHGDGHGGGESNHQIVMNFMVVVRYRTAVLQPKERRPWDFAHGRQERRVFLLISCLIRLRLCLDVDVDIGSLDIELVQIPNQVSIDIEIKYQSCCLDADGIIRWHCTS
jgi:hypothetical protein